MSLTYKVLTTTQPSRLHNLITVQPPPCAQIRNRDPFRLAETWIKIPLALQNFSTLIRPKSPYLASSKWSWQRLSVCRETVWKTFIRLPISASDLSFFKSSSIALQLSPKIHNSLNSTHFACNNGFIFDEHLTFSDQVSSFSKSCYYYIR